MANVAVTGTVQYSGTTTTTDTDVLTLSGWNTSSGGQIEYIRVRNLDAALMLYVRTDGTTPTAAAADGTVIVPPGKELEVAIEPVNRAAGNVVVRLVSSAACIYSVTSRRTTR